MSALAADRTTGTGKVDGGDLSFVVNNGSTVYGGGICLINDSGLQAAVSGSTVTGLRWGGVCIRPGVGNSGGTVTATVRRKGTWSFAKGTAVAADLGKLAYAIDDATVGVTNPNGSNSGNIVGQIIKIIDGSTVEVDLGIRTA